MRRGAGLAVLAVVLLVVGAALVVVVPRHGSKDAGAEPGTAYCSAQVGGHLTEVTVEQARNAALITAIAVDRGLPARAASIALATAYQESFLYNLRYGDRDSLGLFQQRPSQGWGTRAQVLDPAYATNAFYDALDRVPNYTALDITVAAQEVQRSGFPDAYADHEADARTLASALSGNSPAAFTCVLPARPRTGSPRQIGGQVRSAYGVRWRLLQPSGVSLNTRGAVQGWAVAHWVVANAGALGVSTVAFDGRTWTREGSWTTTPEVSRRAVVVQPATVT